ncbi:histidine kinase [Modestobacter sp. I12A-02662]|uniref:histidine kinase n=1 Tax=Modestobacter sp. I12A-02662 TaxID=1730496 RepID=UPI0034DF8DFF
MQAPSSPVTDRVPRPPRGDAADPRRARGAAAARSAAWLVPLACVLSFAVTLGLDVVTPAAVREATANDPGWLVGLPGVLLAGPAAALLRRAPRHPLSWVLAGTALLWAVDGLAGAWLSWAMVPEEPRPLASLAFWTVQRLGSWLLLGLPLLLLLYPDGRLPAGRWRLPAVASLACTAVLPTLLLIVPSEIADARAGTALPAVYDRIDVDPTSLPLPAAVVLPLLRVAFPVALLGVAVPLAVVVARHRRATGERRRQIRWLVWAGVVDLLVMLTALVLPGGGASLALTLAVALTGGAVAVGLLRPRLVDIDRLLGGTLVYGGLAVAVVLLDLAVVAATGTLLGDRLGQRDVALLALLLVTALYVPLRAQLWRVVRRWVLGQREDPYRVVSRLAERLEQSPDPGGQLVAVAATVAEAFRSPYVGVEVEHAGGDQLVAEHGTRPAQVQALPISYRGEEVGRLLLPRSGVRAALLAQDEPLLADVVRQAAAAARASALATELQAIREQLVTAREEERRRLRRDLHDGLGPSLGAVVLRIDTARNLAGRAPEEADRVLRQARDDVAAALADVRRLVHDLRPPALDDLGLTGAVRQQAERLLAPRVVVQVLAGPDVDGLPAAVEVAAYRIASEALANVARHARAASCTVRLAREGGALVVTVTDDGRGIPADATAGVGLASLRERAAELGGRGTVDCPPEGGTVVRAVLPVDGRRTGG